MSTRTLSRRVLYASLLALLPFATVSHAADTAVNFDGADDFIYVASSSTLQDVTDRSFSWCAWAKPASIPPACNTYSEYCVYAVLTRPSNHTYMGYTYAQQFSTRIWNSSNASFTLASGTIGPGAWHHLCLSVDDTAKQMAFYVDGAPVAGSPKTYTGALKDYGGNPYYIGAANPKHWAEMWFFKGAIDEVRIYNRALSSAEVSTQRNGGLGQYGLPEAGLVAGWHMDEGAGWLAGDYSGNGNTGLLAQDTGWTSGKIVTPAGTTPPPAPQGITIEGENMATKTTGSSLGWAWMLAANGYVEHPVTFAPADGYAFLAVVGVRFDGGYPQFALRLDQQNIATQTTNGGGNTYGFFKKGITAGPHQVAVAHINHYNTQAIYVDRIRIVPIGASAPVDTTLPTVSLTAPAGGTTVSGSTVTVSADASDNVGVVGVQFKLDGTNLGAEDTTGPTYSVTWDTTAADGSHTLTATARDAAGNTKTSDPVTVTVANDPPPPPPSSDGKALQFDGVNDYVQVNNSASLQEVTDRSFSFCAWAKPQDVPPTDCNTNNNTCVYGVMSRPGYHTNINYTSGQRFQAEIWTNSTTWNGLSSAIIPPGTWHHLCLAVDDTTKQLHFYVDGAPVAGSPRSYTGALRDYGTLPYYIGAGRPDSSWRWHFKGAIDEGRVYNRALSAAEVSAQYNGGTGQYGAPEAGLVAGWHLDEGAGTSAGDYSGGGNTGTLINGPIWVSSTVAQGPGSTPSPSPSIPQGAFLGEYWNLPSTSGNAPPFPTGTPIASRTDPAINFDWGSSTPLAGINIDDFAVRWQGDWGFATAGTYKFTVTADDGIRMYLDGNLLIDQWKDQGPTTYTAQASVTAGTHRIKTEFYENGGGATAQVTWQLVSTTDTTAPTVSLTAPAGGATLSGSSVTVSATASDNIGVAGVQFKLDGINLGAEDTGNPYSVTWDTKTAANGSHTLTATARDAAGNTKTSDPVAVTVANDTIPPTIISGPTASGITLTSATIAWTTNEPATSKVEYGPTTGYGAAGALDTALVTSHSATLTGLTAGTLYHYRVRSTDATGNEAVSADATFTTAVPDTIPPAITFTSPTNGQILVAP